MKARKSLVLFLITCLCLTLSLCLGVAAEDGAESTGSMDTFTLVSLIILGVVLVVTVVVCIVKREKVVAGLRAYKSELKKITWFPWKHVWRSTLLVVVVVLATATVIGLLDIAFLQAQNAMTGHSVGWFSGLFG